MEESKELKARHRNPDPEMLRKLRMLKRLELLQMMREMGIVEKRKAPEKPGK